jgi:hypothetical protein
VSNGEDGSGQEVQRNGVVYAGVAAQQAAQPACHHASSPHAALVAIATRTPTTVMLQVHTCSVVHTLVWLSSREHKLQAVFMGVWRGVSSTKVSVRRRAKQVQDTQARQENCTCHKGYAGVLQFACGNTKDVQENTAASVSVRESTVCRSQRVASAVTAPAVTAVSWSPKGRIEDRVWLSV